VKASELNELILTSIVNDFKPGLSIEPSGLAIAFSRKMSGKLEK
jgi:hypothetical protein